MYKKLFPVFLFLFLFTACSFSNEYKIENGTLSTDLLQTQESEVQDDDTSAGETVNDTDIGMYQKPLDGVIIVLDPGHGNFTENYKEPVAPGSNEMKVAYSTGTQGASLSEAEFNIIVAEKIKPLLEKQGAQIYLTREDENSISNVERAVFANDLNADLAVRIHADGSTDPSMSGASVLIPANATIGKELEAASRAVGETVLKSLVSSTGAANRGIVERTDLTGFNWSTVPVILVECGFMSNPDEDALLSNEIYQNKIAEGIAEGIIAYFENY